MNTADFAIFIAGVSYLSTVGAGVLVAFRFADRLRITAPAREQQQARAAEQPAAGQEIAARRTA